MTLKKIYAGALALCSGSAGLFYYLQNQWMVETGGEIALSKSIWLFLAILYWIVTPAFVVQQNGICRFIKQAYTLFLVNMLARAIVELVMMYGTHNWHHFIGIGHDIFSILLLIYFIQKISRHGTPDSVWLTTLRIMLWMFIVELGFVFYMLQTVTVAGEQIFFVPAGQDHRAILYLTWTINILLITWQWIIFQNGFKLRPKALQT